MCGVYPDASLLGAGEQISSTYEGRHITMREDELIHPMDATATGFVHKGDPVIICLAATEGTYGKAVGVAFNDGPTTATLVAVDTEGIWKLMVHADTDGPAIVDVNPGDELFISDSSAGITGANGIGNALISKIRNVATQIPFGYALGFVTAGQSRVIAVKVHFDPSLDTEIAKWHTVPTGVYGEVMYTTMAAPASAGICKYFQTTLSGVCAGGCYNIGNWINTAADFTSTAGQILTPYESGIYSAAVNATARIVFGGFYQTQLTGAPATMHVFRLNCNQPASGEITAIFEAANPQSIHYAAGEGGTGVVGTIAFATVPGATLYIDVHAGSV